MMDTTLAIANQIEKIIPGTIIYRENQEQKFAEPSFYIYEITAAAAGELMKREMRSHLYCVVYFPDSSLGDPGTKEQCEIMRSKLLDEFQRIDELSLALLNREAKIESDVLNFTFKLRYRVQPDEATTKIASLEQKGGLKGAN